MSCLRDTSCPALHYPCRHYGLTGHKVQNIRHVVCRTYFVNRHRSERWRAGDAGAEKGAGAGEEEEEEEEGCVS